MRASTPLLAGVFLCALVSGATSACGGKPKQADDPSNESTHKPTTDDGTASTKWEGASAPPPASETKTPKGPGVTSVNEGATRRSDVYDKEATEVVVKRSARQVKENCGAAKDESGKAVGPWGKATIQIQLGHNGRSKGITVPAPYQGKPVGNCVEKAFANLTYPPWGGEDAEISWEIELIDPAAPPAKK